MIRSLNSRARTRPFAFVAHFVLAAGLLLSCGCPGPVETAAPVIPTAAGVWACQENASTTVHRGLSSPQLELTMGLMSGSGSYLVDVERYGGPGSEARYTGVWRQGAGDSTLSSPVSWPEFQQQWSQYQTESRQPIDLETFVSGGQRLFFALWRQGPDSHTVEADLSAADFQQRLDDGSVVDFEVYPVQGEWRFAAILSADPAAEQFVSELVFEDFHQQYHDLGEAHDLVDLEFLGQGEDVRYAGLFRSRPGAPCDPRDHLWVGSEEGNEASLLGRIDEFSPGNQLQLIDLEFAPESKLGGPADKVAEASAEAAGGAAAAGPTPSGADDLLDPTGPQKRPGDPVHDGSSQGPPEPPGSGN